MNRSIIDMSKEFIPVVISLQYGINFLKFQINPDHIKRSIPSESNKTKIEGLGEIGSPSSPGLSTINLSSFFWQDRNLTPSSYYVDWLLKWQKSKKPAKLVVTRLNYSMYVTCENFEYETRAGEENDIYFNLDLQEYRKYGAKKLGTVSKFNLFDWATGNDFAPPILVDIPRPERLNTTKIIVNPYKSKKGDTISSITKYVRGTTSGWKELYEINKEKLGDIVDNEIPIGTELTLPEKWLGVKDYGGTYKPWEKI